MNIKRKFTINSVKNIKKKGIISELKKFETLKYEPIIKIIIMKNKVSYFSKKSINFISLDLGTEDALSFFNMLLDRKCLKIGLWNRDETKFNIMTIANINPPTVQTRNSI